jgi:hypothetical protein
VIEVLLNKKVKKMNTTHLRQMVATAVLSAFAFLAVLSMLVSN